MANWFYDRMAAGAMQVHGIIVNIICSGVNSLDKAVSAADANRRVVTNRGMPVAGITPVEEDDRVAAGARPGLRRKRERRGH